MGIRDWLGLSKKEEQDWLRFEVNDREIEVFDCRSHVMSTIALTADKNIAETFVELLNSDGRQYKGKKPQDSVRFQCELQYNIQESLPEGILFKAIQMEDKYNVYSFNGVIYFTRSWTGDLIFTVETEQDDQFLTLVRAYESQKHWVNDDFSVRVIDFLFRSHCLDMVTPHPLPSEFRNRPAKEIYGYSFAEYGRRAWYATCEDARWIFSEDRYGFPPIDTSILKSDQSRSDIK